MNIDPYALSTAKRTLITFYYSKQRGLSDEAWSQLMEPFETYKDFHEHIIYLSDHGLLDTSACPPSFADDIDCIEIFPEELAPWLIKIEAKGIDFVRCDGGLSSHLNIVKVQFTDDTLDALSKIIDNQPATEEKKSYLKEKLAKIPVDVATGIMTKAIIDCISNPVAVIGTIEMLIHRAST